MDKCEGAVADDAQGVLYIAEELGGIWRVGAEPDDPTPGRRVVNMDETQIQMQVQTDVVLF